VAFLLRSLLQFVVVYSRVCLQVMAYFFNATPCVNLDMPQNQLSSSKGKVKVVLLRQYHAMKK